MFYGSSVQKRLPTNAGAEKQTSKHLKTAVAVNPQMKITSTLHKSVLYPWELTF